VGIAKEARLLKKLIDRGAAEDDERRQFDEAMGLLEDVKCPCCGHPLVEAVRIDADAHPKK